MSCPGHGNDNYNSFCEEDTLGSEKGSRKGKGMKDWKVKGKATEDGNGMGKGKPKEQWKGKGNGNVQGKDIVQKTTGVVNISCAVASMLKKEIYPADSDTEGKLPWL